eukprot:gnl/TRDRNA2_/TRDRNA2_172244_c5_seq14.p1 gnl/TRDRNA2_/TRDRNA2_172244_c5~~gnl/TRDRNA2_/TRDRNA2_172244_c5_seq14.p1  ORF type:complete len:160 (+),score=24.33 gnl/TRDRNA2_/TRDRNA2_172244_c5_seq14:384-863(+)
MQEGWDAQQPRLQHMVRVVSLLQQMKLFGCHFWLGRQIFTVPYDKRSFLDDAPSAVLKINPASSDAEYWICVDTFGIRFAAIADEWSRGFLFSEESTDRVYRWGAKQNVLQLLVHAHNPALPYAGRVSMLISLATPAAVDIVFAIRCAATENIGGARLA